MRANAAPAEPLQDALRKVVEVLESHHVAYALMGGLALAQHAVIRATQDVDFLLSIPQIRLPAVLDDLQSAGLSFDLHETIREWQQHHVTQMEFRGIRIDWVAAVLPAFRDVLDTAVVRRMAGLRVRVASAEGLILLKLIAFREQDKVDVRALLGASEGKLDLRFVRDRMVQIFETDDPQLAWLDSAAEGYAL